MRVEGKMKVGRVIREGSDEGERSDEGRVKG